MSKKNTVIKAASILAVVLLAACSSSDNLRDPVDNKGSSTGCDPSTDQTCVQAQFAGDVVSNLDYECGKIRSVTDPEGFFTCPADSTATFFIGFPNSDKRVILGTTVIKPKKVPSSFASLTGGRVVEVTVADLVLSSGDASANKQVLNILRFLLALDATAGAELKVSADPAIGFRANNHIEISDTVRAKVVDLTESIPATEFAEPQGVPNDELRSSVKAFLTSAAAIDRVPTLDQTQAYYRAFLQGRNAGFFISTATPCAATAAESSTFYDLGMCKKKDQPAFRQAADMNMMVDRTGYVFGFGMSYEGISGSSNQEAITDPVPFFLRGKADAPFAGRAINYVNSKLEVFGDEPTPRFSFEWVGNVRDDAIASTKENYKNLYDEDISTSDARLGLWKQTRDGQTQNGQFLLFNIKAANPYLKKTLYDVTKPSFPKALVFEFRFHAESCPRKDSDTRPSDATLAAEYDELYYCKTRGKVVLSLMPSGNIVTNRDVSCRRVLDDGSAAVLKNEEVEQEWRLGYISSADASALSLTMAFADNNQPALDQLKGILLGVDRNNLALLPSSGDKAFTWTVTTGPIWVDFVKTRKVLGNTDAGLDDNALGRVTARPIRDGEACDLQPVPAT